MFGVLVVQNTNGHIGYLAGYSGMLGGRWNQPGFVPAVFDEAQFNRLLNTGQLVIDDIENQINTLTRSEAYQSVLDGKADVLAKSTQQQKSLRDQHRQRKLQRRQIRALYPHDPIRLEQLAQQSREDKKARRALSLQVEAQTRVADQQLQPFTQSLNALEKRRKNYSAQLQKALFDCYLIPSVAAGKTSLRSLFPDKLPPGGAGDCAAVKLLNAAIARELKPLCVAEFWWGAESGLRRHQRFYPACRSKCRVILPHMLSGLAVSVPVHEVNPGFADSLPETVFEDDTLVVVCKPQGMLSVPGHAIEDSVESRLRRRYPRTDNKTLLLHRLDQATSGLLVAAKSARAYKQLQHQFQQRLVDKTYMAILASTALPAEGEITLPLRVDLDDRPRQMVCHKHGRQALTKFKVLQVSGNVSLVELTPVTGRTHQLRVHAAHPDGLNAPIVGDELYGQSAGRLYLHAQTLAFTHPLNDRRMSFTAPLPFNMDAFTTADTGSRQ